MSFPKYLEYKDSGIQWWGVIPTHWVVSRLKWHLLANDGGVWGGDPDGNDDTIVLRSTEQTVDGRWQIEDPAYRKLSDTEKHNAQLLEGDLLLTKSSGSALHIGKTTLVDKHLSDMECCYSNFMQRLRPADSLLSKMCWYILNNYLAREQFGLLSNSTTGLANLNGSIIGEAIIPIAPIVEQSAIAAFLDRETAKIDALVAEQEKLTELLKEKRQAVISHTVTKGLDPNVPMKDSGVEWLGEGPKHWKVHKLGHKCLLQGGYAFASETFCSDGIPVVRMNNLSRGSLNLEEAAYIPIDCTIDKVSLNEGDLIWGMSGSIGDTGSLGNFARVGSDDLPCQLNQRVGRFFPKNSNLVIDFLEWMIQAKYFYEQILLLVTGTAQFNVSSKQVESCIVTLPPKDEQCEITLYLNAEVKRLDSLQTEAKHAITLLKERRSALISAAVTGKIDVRGLAEATQ
jgi:type I restriction enzyme, S subunit